MENRYYVCGLGYDENDCVTDYEKDFGDFDTYDEAYELFVELTNRDDQSFFTDDAENIHTLLIQVEECEETDEAVTCVDVKNEIWIVNPSFSKEDRRDKSFITHIDLSGGEDGDIS